MLSRPNMLMVDFWTNRDLVSLEEGKNTGLWVDTVSCNGVPSAIIIDENGKIKSVPIRLVRVPSQKKYDKQDKDSNGSLSMDLS
jgi:hypothetical protein